MVAAGLPDTMRVSRGVRRDSVREKKTVKGEVRTVSLIRMKGRNALSIPETTMARKNASCVCVREMYHNRRVNPCPIRQFTNQKI